MKAIEIVVALAISLLAMAGIGCAYDIPAITQGDFQFSEQINRPGNFAFSDTATMTGWNNWEHQSMATAGTFDSTSMFKTLDVPSGAAPEEKSLETVTLNFLKNGQGVDPLIGERIESDITVGAVSTNVVPTFTSAGDITANPDERYDTMHYVMSGSAGTPVFTNGELTGITDDMSRQVSSQIMSSQDDFIHVQGFDSAGNENPVLTSFTDVIIPGRPGTSESQAYRQFNWQDSRGWKPDGTEYGTWNNNNLIHYQVYQIPFNFGK